MTLTPASTEVYRTGFIAFSVAVGVGFNLFNPACAVVVSGAVRSEAMETVLGIPIPLVLCFMVVSLGLLAILLITRSLIFAVLFALIEIVGLTAMAKTAGWDQADVACQLMTPLPVFDVIASI